MVSVVYLIVLTNFKRNIEFLKEAAGMNRNGIIIFPEGTNFSKTLGQFLGPEGLKSFFDKLSDQNILIIDSLRVVESSGDLYSRTVFIDSKFGAIGFYNKEILVPAGEFLPYILKWPLFIASPSLREKFKNYQEFSKGNSINVFDYSNLKIKSLICSDIISPSKSRFNNADLIILTGSTSAWKGSKIIDDQLLKITRLRAIENGKYSPSLELGFKIAKSLSSKLEEVFQYE